jgi:rubrerythrin
MESKYEDIISFAMQWEEDSANLYKEMIKLTKNPNVKAMFEEFEAEEEGHKAIIDKLSKNKVTDLQLQNITDLKISDYLIDMTFRPDMDYQDILIIAMKREEKAVKMYTDMLAKVKNSEAQKLIQFLIQEESKHKLRLETEYDENVLAEN